MAVLWCIKKNTLKFLFYKLNNTNFPNHIKNTPDFNEGTGRLSIQVNPKERRKNIYIYVTLISNALYTFSGVMWYIFQLYCFYGIIFWYIF